MATFHLHGRLLLVAWLLGGPAIAQAQTPPSESELLARIAALPQQVSNYLELAKLYDQAQRYDDELAILRRATDVLGTRQTTVSFTPALSPHGCVRDLKMISGNPTLTAAAVRTVKSWQCEPVLLNGRPVDLIFSVSVQFKPR